MQKELRFIFDQEAEERSASEYRKPNTHAEEFDFARLIDITRFAANIGGHAAPNSAVRSLHGGGGAAAAYQLEENDGGSYALEPEPEPELSLERSPR